jgi:membrane protein
MLLNRLLSFSIVIGLGFLLLVSLVITGLVEALSNRLLDIFPQTAIVVIYIFNILVTFSVVTLLFAIIFKMLPDAKISWRDVGTGAMVTATLFMIGKFAIGLYINTSNIGTTYGTAGSFVVILIWIYYSSIILFLGAEFTKAYAAAYGRPIRPNNYAVWVKLIEVENSHGSLQQHELEKKEQNEASADNISIK